MACYDSRHSLDREPMVFGVQSASSSTSRFGPCSKRRTVFTACPFKFGTTLYLIADYAGAVSVLVSIRS